MGSATSKPFEWLTDKSWLDCVKLSKMAHFEQLVEAMTEHSLLWRAWVLSDAPEEGNYPPPYGGEVPLSPFRKLMLLRYLCYSGTYDTQVSSQTIGQICMRHLFVGWGCDTPLNIYGIYFFVVNIYL